jgi:hypothetical protein
VKGNVNRFMKTRAKSDISNHIGHPNIKGIISATPILILTNCTLNSFGAMCWKGCKEKNMLQHLYCMQKRVSMGMRTKSG